VDPIEDAVLDQARQEGDPAADRVIASLVQSGQMAAVEDLVTMLLDHRGALHERLPPVVRDYIEKSSQPPDVDGERLARGEAVFAEYAPVILVVLGFYSLPAAYAAKNGVQVLYRTGYLRQRPLRRVFETTRMVVDMLRPGALGPGGSAVRTAQKVRLIHAGVRHVLRSDPHRPWPSAFGLPINQEDMAGTLMTFSFLVLDGLEKLNLRLSPADREDYLYAWVSIGRLMGIRDDLLPGNLREAEALTRRIYSRQIAESTEGKLMTQALIQGMKGLWPGTWLDGMPAAIIRHFLHDDPFGGRDVAQLLGVPHADWTAHLVRAAVWAAGALTGGGIPSNRVRRRVRRLRLVLIDGLLRVERAGQRGAFEIPGRLTKQRWASAGRTS
jgi:hypothetical protein